MSHAHMQGSETSESERPIIIGNEEALSTALFDDVIDYVALGHLHKPQKVGQAHIRYSGSPLPLSFSEINYKHQIVDASIDVEKTTAEQLQLNVLPIPRAVELYRIRGTIEEVLQQLTALPQGEIPQLDQRHFVEIEYHTQTPPPPNLRQVCEDALPLQRYRLVRIARKHISTQAQQDQQKIALEPPTPEKLFLSIWDQQGFEPDQQVFNDFAELVHNAQKSLEDDAI